MDSISKAELRAFDGNNGRAYVAYKGRVYDVSASFQWRNGVHQIIHRAGCDLTDAMREAPHGPEFLDRFPVVTELAREEP